MAERKGLGCRSCGIGCAVVIVVLGSLGAGYYSLVNRIPSPPKVSARLPNPNARDVYFRAKPLLPTGLPVSFREIENLPEPRLEAIVRKSGPALRFFEHGLPLEYGAPPVTSFEALRPELKVFRDLVKLKLAESRLAERRGDFASAASGYLSILRFAAQISNGPGVRDSDGSIVMQKAALRGLERLTPGMKGDLAQKTLREIETLEKQVLNIDETLKREALYNESALIEAMWIARSGSPQAKADVGWAMMVFGYDPRYLLTPKEQYVGAMRQYYEAVRAVTMKPYWERGPLPKEPHDPVNTLLLTPLQGTVFAFDTAGASFQLVKVKLAFRAYERSVGRAPSNLEDLTPRFIPSIQDSFSGKPLQLNRNRSTGIAMVYSLGPDQDDDGGRPVEDAIRPTSDGDLTRVPFR